MKISEFTLRHKCISALRDINVIGIRKLANTLPHFVIPRPSGEVIVKTLYGFLLKVDPVHDKGVDRTVYYTGTYEKGTLAIMQYLLRDGDVFCDVGANIGLMTLFASQCVQKNGKVLAFEPHPNTREILNENIRLNGRQNIKVSPYALGSEKATSRIYDRWVENKGAATLIDPGSEVESYDIEVVRLEDVVSQDEIPQVIKVDIEGFELEALKGFRSWLSGSNSPMLIVECSGERENTFGSDTTSLYEFFNRFQQYRVFKSIAGKERISKLVEILKPSEMPKHDNIYCFTQRHLVRIPQHIFVTPRRKQ